MLRWHTNEDVDLQRIMQQLPMSSGSDFPLLALMMFSFVPLSCKKKRKLYQKYDNTGSNSTGHHEMVNYSS